VSFLFHLYVLLMNLQVGHALYCDRPRMYVWALFHSCFRTKIYCFSLGLVNRKPSGSKNPGAIAHCSAHLSIRISSLVIAHSTSLCSTDFIVCDFPCFASPIHAFIFPSTYNICSFDAVSNPDAAHNLSSILPQKFGSGYLGGAIRL